MVFHPEGQYSQFPHCKFRENIVRLLHIPSIVDINRKPSSLTSPPPPPSPSSPSHLFLAVNKFGKVGLYHPEKFSLVHTYCLDLSVNPTDLNPSSNHPVIPKCARTHLVTDAIYCPDALCVIFSTTKMLLQWYDIGEIQNQDIGLNLFPRREFLSLSEHNFPVTHIPHRGHIESHRLFGLQVIPTCMEYYQNFKKLIIGDVDGGITLISIPTPRYPLGRRKIRGTLHKIWLSQLPPGIVQYYKGHHSPVSAIQLIPERNLILSASSRDKKFSVYVKDLSEMPMESIMISIPKGVNAMTYSLELKMVATGSDDFVVRLFNQFVMKLPQMELLGHRSPVMAVEFVKVDFYVAGAEQGDDPVLLLSYSADSELRAWDPLTFICLQSTYLSFPPGSTIMCKTPEFPRKSMFLLLPNGENDFKHSASEPPTSTRKSGRNTKMRNNHTSTSGTIILLYCNSYARIPLEKEGSTRWPGIDYDKFIREFEELSSEYEQKLKGKLKEDGQGDGHPSHSHHHHHHQYHSAPVAIKEEVEEEEDHHKMEDGEGDGGRVPELEKRNANGSVCLQLTKQDKAEMERKVDTYLKEIMELRKSIKEQATSRIEDREAEDEEEEDGGRSREPLSVSIQATNRFYEFKRAKQQAFQEGLPQNLQRMISYGNAFNQYPVFELEPIQFSQKALAIPEKMKKELGITSVSCVEDLMKPEAQRYFGIDIGTGSSGRGLRRTAAAAGEQQGVGGGGSFFYNFNHNQQKEKRRNVEKEGAHHHRQDNRGSRFTVFGQRIRNAYEDENFLFPPTREGEEDGEGGGIA